MADEAVGLPHSWMDVLAGAMLHTAVEAAGLDGPLRPSTPTTRRAGRWWVRAVVTGGRVGWVGAWAGDGGDQYVVIQARPVGASRWSQGSCRWFHKSLATGRLSPLPLTSTLHPARPPCRLPPRRGGGAWVANCACARASPLGGSPFQQPPNSSTAFPSPLHSLLLSTQPPPTASPSPTLPSLANHSITGSPPTHPTKATNANQRAGRPPSSACLPVSAPPWPARPPNDNHTTHQQCQNGPVLPAAPKENKYRKIDVGPCRENPPPLWRSRGQLSAGLPAHRPAAGL